MITATQAQYLKKCEEYDALAAEDNRLARQCASRQSGLGTLKGTIRAQVIREIDQFMQARAALLPKLQRAALEREAANMAYRNELKQMEHGIMPAPAQMQPTAAPLLNDAQWQHVEQLARALRNEDLKALAKVKVAVEFLNLTMPILKKAREVTR